MHHNSRPLPRLRFGLVWHASCAGEKCVLSPVANLDADLFCARSLIHRPEHHVYQQLPKLWLSEIVRVTQGREGHATLDRSGPGDRFGYVAGRTGHQ